MEELENNKKSFWNKYFFIAFAAGVSLVCLFYFLFFSPPSNFPKGTIFSIESGENLKNISLNLKKEKIIRSAVIFQTLSILLGDEKNIKYGDYFFESPVGVLEVVKRTLLGESKIPLVKVTIPEGSTNREIATILAKNIPNFDQSQFLTYANGKEGYLFPDTYFLNQNIEQKIIVDIFIKNLNKKIESLKSEIKDSSHSLSDILIMASILEKEASGKSDIFKISGVLWKRIDIGMPLQTDATISYITGKESKEMTRSDLEIDSKWNTYKYKGLPVAPIGNPGILAIEAALRPEKSDYLYYLHDSKGNAYFAKDFEEHKSNKAKYLK